MLGALEQGSPSAVLVAESRPGGEGVDVAERLARECPVTLATDAAFPTRLSSWDADLLPVGADTVGPDGRVRNKVGTAPAAVVAGRAGVRVVVAAATDKVTPCLSHGDDPWPTALYDGDAPLATANPTFDVTPADAIETIATDRGPLALDDVAAVAAEHDRRADWPR